MIEIYRFFKRCADFLLSLIFLILFSPGLLLLALLIWISDGRPIIFKSERVGKNKKIFTVYKFRTLVNGVKRRKDGLSPKKVINRIAEYMRDTHLDEVLQMFNIMKGEMALIGPRPLDVPRYEHLKSHALDWDSIFAVKPGMTCLNQIAKYSTFGMKRIRRLKGLGNLEERNRLLLDKYYVQYESPLLDLRIGIWTIEYLLLGLFTKVFKKEEMH